MTRESARRETSPDLARRAVKRALGYAYVSGISLIVLGVISATVSIRNPLSASFGISLAVIVNGVIEYRLAKRLRDGCVRAPARMALNQLVLGFEIVAYSAWQIYVLTPEAVQQILARPMVADVLGMLEPEVVQLTVELLPPMVRMLYLIVAIVAVLGCAGVAWFYQSREKHQRVLNAAETEAVKPPPLAV